MSDLFERVRQLYDHGHAAAPPALWIDPRIHDIPEFTPAAVLIALTDRPDPGVLLLHRPSTMRAHAGQVAFPGGKIDPGEDAEQAALREAHEELGIHPDQVRVIGSSDLYRTGSGYEITPIIGIVSPDIEIRPNPAEVSQWFEAPAGFVFDEANHKHPTIEWEGRRHRFVQIDWEEHCIWGVTGAIVHNLARRLAWHG